MRNRLKSKRFAYAVKPKKPTFAVIDTNTHEEKKPLFLIMQRVWFDKIADGVKIEEYRDESDFYYSRFCTKDRKKFKRYKTAILQEGYHTGARRMTIEVNKITLDDCFTIHLGPILERQNF